MKQNICVALLLIFGVAGCGSIVRDDSDQAVKSIIPNKTINISKSLSIPFEVLALGAAVYLITDPMAPNWQIEESKIAADTFRIAMRQKRFVTGGDGEAVQIFRHRAEQIMRDHGYAGYQVLEYTEGIESITIGARRVSQGVVMISKAPQARLDR